MDTSEIIVVVVGLVLLCIICFSVSLLSIQDYQEPPFVDDKGAVSLGGVKYYGLIPEESITNTEKGWTITPPTKEPLAPGYFAVVSKSCGHCHDLIENAQKALKTKPFTFVFMEGDDSPEAIVKAEALDVQGYPTVWNVTSSGELIPYGGSRSADALAINSSPKQD